MSRRVLLVAGMYYLRVGGRGSLRLSSELALASLDRTGLLPCLSLAGFMPFFGIIWLKDWGCSTRLGLAMGMVAARSFSSLDVYRLRCCC